MSVFKNCLIHLLNKSWAFTEYKLINFVYYAINDLCVCFIWIWSDIKQN